MSSQLDGEIPQFRFLDQDGKLTKSSIKVALKPPYPPKYYLNLVVTITGLVVFLLWNFGVIPGNKLGFFCNDPLFSHKYQGDTITPVILGVGLNVVFFGIYFSVEIIRRGNFKDAFRIPSLTEHYIYLKSFVLGIVIVGGVTEIAKTIVGEHRPHFFDSCMPDTNRNCTNGTYIYDFTCTNPDITLIDRTDTSRSFPSGHSSIAWFTGLFSAYIVHTRLPTHRTGTAFKVLMFGICMTFGLLCSLTRITDRRHHWWDVLTGAVIAAVGTAYIIRLTHQQVKMLHTKADPEELEHIDSNV